MLYAQGKVEMNWDAVGAVAEFAAATAVFVTLLFVLKQLRQNSLQMENSTAWAVTQGLNSVNMDLAANAELSEIWMKARDGFEKLDIGERGRFRNVVYSRLNVASYIMDHHEEGATHTYVVQLANVYNSHQGFKFITEEGSYNLLVRVFQDQVPKGGV